MFISESTIVLTLYEREPTLLVLNHFAHVKMKMLKKTMNSTLYTVHVCAKKKIVCQSVKTNFINVFIV